ncbi:MAG: endonuclease/exonuclease/phosphatase family protein [Siphonobacter sp.]
MKTSTISISQKTKKRIGIVELGLLVSVWGLLLVSLIGRLGQYFYLFELFSHFAVQCLAAGIILLPITLVMRSPLSILTAAAIAINAWQVIPWIMPKSQVINQRADLRVMHTNVLFTNTDCQKDIKIIKQQNPDILLVAEATPSFFQAFRKNLHQQYPYEYIVYAKSHCYMLIGSRTPLTVFHEAVRANRMLHVRTRIKGKEIAIVSVHPRTPLFASWYAIRNNRLKGAFQEAKQETLPTILAGDFNISVFSPVYQSFMAETGLDAARKGFGIAPTYRNGYGPFMIPIDHILTKGFKTSNFYTLDMPGSDHKAVVADLKLD